MKILSFWARPFAAPYSQAVRRILVAVKVISWSSLFDLGGRKRIFTRVAPRTSPIGKPVTRSSGYLSARMVLTSAGIFSFGP